MFCVILPPYPNIITEQDMEYTILLYFKYLFLNIYTYALVTNKVNIS